MKACLFNKLLCFRSRLQDQKRKMTKTLDISTLFHNQGESWDPDSELGSIIYLTREPITELAVKATVIASNEVMKSRGNNCKIVREAGGDSFCSEIDKQVAAHGTLQRGECRAIKASGLELQTIVIRLKLSVSPTW